MSQLTTPRVPGARPRVVIIGGGFAGINAARALGKLPVDLTVIDRRNHHVFQPLLYQVALAVLSPADIAQPIRGILARHQNTQVLMDEVTAIDTTARSLSLSSGATISYDYLILATGATHSYFGHEEWAKFAPGLKSIEDATEIRRRVLLAFELAERQMQEHGWHPPLNFIIIGAGPTGVELAGTLAEIAHHAMNHEFRNIDPRQSRILLIEGGPRVLPAYPEDLSRSAEEQLRHLGVDVRTSQMVTGFEAGAVRMGETRLPAAVILWAAGVAASADVDVGIDVSATSEVGATGVRSGVGVGREHEDDRELACHWRRLIQRGVETHAIAKGDLYLHLELVVGGLLRNRRLR